MRSHVVLEPLVEHDRFVEVDHAVQVVYAAKDALASMMAPAPVTNPTDVGDEGGGDVLAGAATEAGDDPVEASDLANGDEVDDEQSADAKADEIEG